MKSAVLMAVLALGLAGGGADASTDVVLLEQGWNVHERRWFHHVNQGSRLLPYAVFLALPDADGQGLFRADAHLSRFGLLAAPVSQYNPEGLPVGLARDRAWLGLTCAACHTSEFRYGGSRVRVEGGQAMLDLPRLLRALEQAMARTLEEPALLTRFAARLSVDEAAARTRLAEALAERRGGNARNATDVPYGYARLDAFGAILNKGLALTGVPGNRNPPDAPTSYPYLWDTPQHDWVEWNGASPNPLEGALARNVGEVIGVFGTVEPVRRTWLGFDRGYGSSIRLRTLRRIEKQVARLTSPVWPEHVLPRIDRALAARGQPLFEQYCGACHLPLTRDDPGRSIQVRMSSLAAAGTDPRMAENALGQRGVTGPFEGETRFYVAGDTLAREAPALYIVNHVMGGVMTRGIVQTLLAQRDARLLGHGDERHPPKYLDGVPMPRGTETSARALLAYKARPLNGIWATAPYLHNGSVPNLYELMLPQSERSATFTLGSWRFDPDNVGYRDETCENGFVFDTALPGNSNAGHEYGTGADGLPALDEAARRAVVEYLKTL